MKDDVEEVLLERSVDEEDMEGSEVSDGGSDASGDIERSDRGLYVESRARGEGLGGEEGELWMLADWRRPDQAAA